MLVLLYHYGIKDRSDLSAPLFVEASVCRPAGHATLDGPWLRRFTPVGRRPRTQSARPCYTSANHRSGIVPRPHAEPRNPIVTPPRSIELNTALYVVYVAVMVYGWLIIARALLSWFPVRPGNPLYRVRGILFMLTEPYLRLFRRILPTARVGAAGIDMSAMVGLIVLFVVAQIIVRV
jgi:YggT family protein